ncbi:hypothetical protein N657DRAFT_646950 [Parathielavia appendiculata]|uniref:Rhodopsin domain-containing protein n=1 Tax=Parathielavia appendiculata TaxID=2587402 RepID=A0AAN6TWX8_9PEZI|nr:hypothetical protein N657DRAFT_646950 [Parathielavia appendiculata]
MSDPAWPALPPEKAAESNGPQMLIIGWTFTAIATLFVTGRIFSRFKKLGRIGTGDYFVLVSLALGYIYITIVTVAVDAGSGRHLYALTVPQAERALLFTFISFIPGILSFTMPKFAVVMLIRDLLNPSPGHLRAIWALAIVNAVLIVISITFTYAQCDPPRAQWTIGLKARCWNPIVLVATSITMSASSALFDFWLALYPAIVLWRMPINRRKKVALSTALGFGVCAGSVAVYKGTRLKPAGDFSDFTYNAAGLVIWTSIEANSVIISACIPMLMPMAERIFGENFLSGGYKPRIRTITTLTHPEREDTSSNAHSGAMACAREREDWHQRAQNAGMSLNKESVHSSLRSEKSNV